MKFKIILFGVLTGLSFVLVELLLAIPSHSECGTNAAVDVGPCAYVDRLSWALNDGSWILPLILWIVANIVFISVATQPRKKS